MSSRQRSSRGKKPNKPRIGYFWPDKEPFTALPVGVYKSDAFKSLTLSGQAVLIDWLRVYYCATKNEKERLPEGMKYAYEVCKVAISDVTFYKARKEIIEHGFFETPPGLQPDRVAEAVRLVPSTKWRDYRCPRLSQHFTKKHARLRVKRKRRTDARQKAPEDSSVG